MNGTLSSFYSGPGLASALVSIPESDFVRIVGTWISRAVDWKTHTPATGDEKVDAIVAAACGYMAVRAGEPEPTWTQGRELKSFWHPGLPGLFAWSFAHTPASFKRRGVIIELDSLVSV